MISQSFNPDVIFQQLPEQVNDIPLSVQESIIQCALKCVESRVKYHSEPLQSSTAVKNYLRLQIAQEPNEIFAILFLDTRHRALVFEKLFQGTINFASVHPRVVVQRALFHNAAAVVLVHNHPSGDVEPSREDIQITRELKNILKAIDVTVLDHFIVSVEGALSLAERGLV